MEKVKSRRNKSVNIQKNAEAERRLREQEEEVKKDQRRIEVINRREMVRNFGRKKKEKATRGIPESLKIGDCVLIKQGIGIVRYIGPIIGSKRKDQLFAGVELKETQAVGLNDGTAFGSRYFHCEGKSGVFVRHIQKVLQPENILRQLGKLNSDLKQKTIDNAALRIENEDLMRKFEAEKEKAKLVEIEIFNHTDSDGSTSLPRRLTNISTFSDDDEKLPTITDGKKFDPPDSVLNKEKTSIRIKMGTSPGIKKKQLFRLLSEKMWTNSEFVNFGKELQKELTKGHRENALQSLDLPDFNAPDDDFIKWLRQKFQQFMKLETGFQIPDIGDVKVKKALLVVTRMLARLSQQVQTKESQCSLPQSFNNEEVDSFTSASSEDDF